MDLENFDIKLWEKEFDKLNKFPEENSDLDSDQEIDSTQSVITQGVAVKPGLSTENFFRHKPIQISIVGKEILVICFEILENF